jgi:hypothetical protein
MLKTPTLAPPAPARQDAHVPAFVLGAALLTTILSILLFGTEAAAFKIVEPKEGATLKPGTTVPARVELGNDVGVVRVRYFWYAESADTLVEREGADPSAYRDKIANDKFWQKDSVVGGDVVAIPVLVGASDSTPPFGGKLRIPMDGIGRMRLLAVGDISRGRLGTSSVFDEIFVTVEPDAELQSIEFETDKPLRLGRGQGDSSVRAIAPATGMETYGFVDSLGKIFELPVVAVFSDGVTRAINQPGAGTTYTSANEKVIKVLRDGLLQIVGNGRTTLTVGNRGKQADLDVIVDVGESVNEPPIADPGQNRSVKAGSRVQLNGLKSRDPEGEALFYSWSQVRGAKLPLLDVNMPVASFVAPNVSTPRTLRFKLRVTDKQGADSLPAYVDVIVEP